MTQQYIRKVSLVLNNASGGSADLSQLHFKFKVLRGDIQTPNTADIRVYNVSDKTANAIQQEFSTLTLQAGYAGSYGVIFSGTIKQVRRGRENATDTYLDITAADGDGAYNFAFINTSLKAGATPAKQVATITSAMNGYGITQGNVDGLDGQALPRGKVLFGMAKDHMRTISNSTQTSWSIQNGQVNVVPLNSFIQNTTVVINSATGMIGLPEQTLDGIKVRTLLNPNIKIGGSIQINNKSIQSLRFDVGIQSAATNAILQQSIHTNADGLYKVLWVDYTGDTRGNDFYSEITCVSIDAVVGAALLSKSTALGPVGAPIPSNVTPPVKPYAPSSTFGGQN